MERAHDEARAELLNKFQATFSL